MGPLFLDQNPREIRFAYEGRNLSPQEVFSHLYQGLEVVVESNRRTAFGKQMVVGGQKIHPRRGNTGEVYTAWVNSSGEPITAEMRFDDASTHQFTVERRTNFKLDHLFKIPSIAYLHDEEGNYLILREARAYPLEELMIPFVKNQPYWKKFDLEKTRQFYGFGGESPLQAARHGRTVYIPEPHLIAGLESLYSEIPTFPRLTPAVAVVKSSKDKLWYLRDYFPQVVPDTPIHFDALSTYFGTLHALGLMELLDRQMIHYGLRGKSIQNYDPDFMLHTITLNVIADLDWGDLKKELKQTDAIFNQKGIVRDLKDRMNRVQERLAGEWGISRTTFLRHLSGTVTADSLSKVDLMI